MAEGILLVKELSGRENCGACLNFVLPVSLCPFLKLFSTSMVRKPLAISVLDLLRTEIAHGALKCFCQKSKWMTFLSLFCICQVENPDILW